MADDDTDTERFESIPWSTLLPDESDKRATWINVAGGVVLALVAMAIVWRFMGGSGPTVVSLPEAPDVAIDRSQPLESSTRQGGLAGQDAAPGVTVTTGPRSEETPPADSAEITTPAVTTFGQTSGVSGQSTYSEADLMAVVPDAGMQAAIARAEWFVADYFTVDGDAASVASVLEALPVMPRGPSFGEQLGKGVSYVEWARATEITLLGPGEYRVVVAFRTLAGPEGSDVLRRPVRAVAVDVAVSHGASGVKDLPTPVAPPATLGQTSLAMDTAGNVPSGVMSAGLELVHAAGYEGEAIGSALLSGVWRLTFAVADRSGLLFPMRIWVTPDGSEPSSS